MIQRNKYSLFNLKVKKTMKQKANNKLNYTTVKSAFKKPAIYTRKKPF